MLIACVWVKGNVPFAADYVFHLRSMVQRHMGPTEGWRFVCLTDRPKELPGVETIKIPSPKGWPGWWSKLELFNPIHFPAGESVIYLDLDVLVLDRLWLLTLWHEVSTLTLIPHEGAWKGAGGLAVVQRYNSSVMAFTAGEHSDLFTEWNPGVAKRLWGDQDWIGTRKPNQLTFPLRWFPRISAIGEDRGRAAGARVVLCKSPKNHLAAAKWPWVRNVWMGKDDAQQIDRKGSRSLSAS